MEQGKKKRNKIGLIILSILLLLLVASSGIMVLVEKGVFQPKTEIANVSDAEKKLREKLAAEGSDTIEITEAIEIHGGPLIVNGNKKLTGAGSLIALGGFEEKGALLEVSSDAELDIEEVELNANQSAESVLHIAKSGVASIGKDAKLSDSKESNVFNEGTFTMAGGMLRKGKIGIRNCGTAVVKDGIIAMMDKYLVDNRIEGTLEIKGGSFQNSVGYGLYNRGSMTMSGAEVTNNALMGICNLGVASVKDSKVAYNSRHNILNKSRAKLTLENTNIEKSGQAGIFNEEGAYAILTTCTLLGNASPNIDNRGELEVYKSELKDVANSSISTQGKVSTTYIEDTSISNTTSNGHGIMSVMDSKVEVNNVTFVNMSKRAIHNKGGHVTGKDIVVDGSGGVAVGNSKYDDGSFGTVKLKNVKILSTTNCTLINDCDGSMEIDGGELCVTQNNNVRVAAGTMTLKNVIVKGTKKVGNIGYHGVYANGGVLNLTDCTIKNTSSRGINNQGATINIDKLTITDTGAAAMGNMALKNGGPSIIHANNLTITGAGTNSICNEGDTSKIKVTNSVINPAGGNSVRVAAGEVTMKDTKIYGSSKKNCVAVKVEDAGTTYLQEGTLITNKVGSGVQNAGKVYIEGAYIEKCQNDSSGAGINNSVKGIVIMTDGNIRDCVAQGSGGAVFNSGYFEMTGGYIETNKSLGVGGAVNVAKDAKFVVRGGTIRNNHATSGFNASGAYKSGDSGAINVSSGATMEMSGGTIENNISDGSGGGIRVSGNLVMTDGVIRGNKTGEALDQNGNANGSSGGGVLVIGSMTMTGGTISNNTAVSARDKENAILQGHGGGIFVDRIGKLMISNGTISENIAEGQGGAICLTGADEKDNTSLVSLTKVILKDNESQGKSSGAVFVGKYRELAIEKGTVISGNTSKTHGGAINLGGSGSKLTMNGGTISKNTALGGNGGGAIYMSSDSELVMKAGDICENKASVNGGGGAIYVGQNAVLNIIGGTISGNAAGQGGAILLLEGVEGSDSITTVLKNVEIIDNHAEEKSSGAIFVGKYRELTIEEGTVISENTSKTQGGAINLAGAGSKVTMNAGQISKNIANGGNGGGAIYVSKDSEFNMNGGTISGNTAKGTQGGGAIYAGDSSGKGITITGGNISENIANINGGAICLNGTAKLTMTGGTLRGNTAGGNGGAIHAVVASTIDLSNVELSGNTAGGQGGAINLPGSSAGNLMKLTNVKIRDNIAETKSSGAIYVGASRQLELNGDTTEISGNTAATYGGAIGTGAGASVTINAGTISGNTAATYGGAIGAGAGASVTIKTGNISENTAKSTYGGAICLNENAKLIMTGGTLKGNTAESDGGAIHAMINSEMELSNVELSGNTAGGQGGAINLPGGAGNLVKLTNVKIKNNITETKSSGAIYVGASRQLELNGENTEISGNTAATYGGAIGTGAGASVTINAGTISENIANGGNGGGGIYLNTNVIFTMNGGAVHSNTVASGGLGENIYINSGAALKLAENANLNSVYFATGTTPIQVLNNTLNYPVTVTCTSANQNGILVLQKAESSNADLKGLCENDKIIMGAGFDDPSYELIETEQGMAWTKITTVTTFADLKSAIESTDNTLKYIKLLASESLSIDNTISVMNNSNIILIGNATMIRANGFTGEFFNVAAGSELTLKGTSEEKTLILDGAKSTVTAARPLIHNNGTLNINEDVVLQNNKNTTTDAGSYGGAIYLENKAQLIMNGGTLINNESLQGGAINVNNGGCVINLTNATITGNKATSKSSGAIFMGNNSIVTINAGTKINNNTAATNGGAFNITANAELIMNGGEISGNIAMATGDNGGGAIYMSADAKLTITNGAILNNETKGTRGGAAIYAGNTKGITISGGTISGNKAKNGHGGAIQLNGTTGLTMTGGTLSENEAKQGGAININNASAIVNLTNVTITSNRSTSASSGAIYVVASGKLTINEGTNITNNTAYNHGGAICLAGSATLTMNGGEISGNTASCTSSGNGGGGVYMSGNAIFKMNGGTVKDNQVASGKKGENIYFSTGTLELSGSAKLASIYSASGTKIQVTAPLTAESFVTEIILATYTTDKIVVSYNGTDTSVDMASLLSKFSVANVNYKLSLDGNNIKLVEQ